MYCDKCGREIEDGSLFCKHCGASLGGEAPVLQPETAAATHQGPPPYAPTVSQGPVPPVPPAYPVPPGGGMGSAPQPAVPAAGKSKAVPVLVTVCALLLVGVVVLVLMLTVFKGDGDSKGEIGAPADPASVAESFLKALEERDLDGLIDLLDPALLEELEDEYGREYEDILESYFLADMPEDLEFSDLEFSQEIEGDRAEAFLEGGRVSYRDDYGEKVEEDLEDAVGDAGAELDELLRVLQKLNHLDQLHFGLIAAGHIGEGDNRVLSRHAAGTTTPEGEGLVGAALGAAHGEEEESADQQNWEQIQQEARYLREQRHGFN